MKILITNDDGIYAEGLWHIVKALEGLGDIYVVAPDRDMSGVGTAMTITSVLRTQEFPSYVEGVKSYVVQGTPSDSVILATEAMFDEPFDVLVSGINPGANLGLDVFGSGTVGAALQGYYRNIPSIAISSEYTNGMPVGILSLSTSSSLKPSRYCARARRVLPWAAIRMRLPS